MAKAKAAGNKRQKVKQNKEVTPPIINQELIIKAAGLSLILLSIFLFIAFSSYFFTWKQDQMEGWNLSLKLLFSKDWEVENRLGRLGAFLSVLLVDKLYGIAAYFIAILSFVLGVNLVSQKRIFKFWKWFIHSILLTLIITTAAHFIFINKSFPFGGGLGKMLFDWLSTLIGKTGLIILLVFVGGIYISSLRFVRELFSKNLFSDDEKHTEEAPDKEETVIEKESLIPEEIVSPVPHFDDKGFEVLDKRSITQKEKKPSTILKDIQDEKALNLEPVLKNPPKKHAKKPEIDKDLSLDIEEVKEEKISEKKVVTNKGDLSTSYDPKLDLPGFKFPTLDMLEDHGGDAIQIDREELEQNKNQIVQTLSNYNIQISKIKATVGPTVTLYEIVPAPGVRISKIKNLEDDIALSLAALGIRIIAPIPGKGTIGIEVPNVNKNTVSMKSMLASEKFRNSDMMLPMAIGKTISNEIYITDLAKMPHLLMAGATGQGKSVGLNAIIVSLLYKLHPSELKFVMVDPKKVELNIYQHIEKHYLAKLPGEEDSIITDTKKVIHTLNALCIEMDQRYELLKNAQVRNIKEYNAKFSARRLNPAKGHRFLPFIVLVVDEFADLMMTAGKEVEMPIARLAQLARAIGIHLIIATQRPSVNIITGVIKANFPGRVAFKVTSKVDSRTILDAGGADQLIGRGDMLLSINGNLVRLQCPFVDTPEVDAIVQSIGDQRGYEEAYLLPEYIDPKEQSASADDILFDRDDLFDEAARIIVQHQQGSTSLIQRRLKLGYNRAGRLIDQLEAAGIVGPNVGSKAREVYIPDEYELERFLKTLEEEQ